LAKYDAPIMIEDRATGFSVPGRNARGRLVQLGPALQAVLGAHDYPAPIADLLAEALTLTALLGVMLKDAGSVHDADDLAGKESEHAGQLTLQAQTDGGIVRLLVCDYRAGAVRGYVQFDAERLAMAGSNPSLFALFGKAYLAITFDQPTPGTDTNARYQGIVPLDGESLAQAAEHYFDQSEQIPSMVRIAVQHTGYGYTAAGLLLQHLPHGEVGRERLHVRKDHPDWESVEVLGRSITDAELLDPHVPASELLWRLFSDAGEIRMVNPIPLTKGCRCNPDHIADVLSRFPETDRAEMRGDDGKISVDCAFCSKVFLL
jgi:molecular chaperone Hsp33